MPKPQETKSVDLCHGGRSADCLQAEHPKSAKLPDIFCYYCQERMGCWSCVQRPTELFCLYCNNWASRLAMRVHGPVVGDSTQTARKIKEVIKKLVG